MTPITIDQAMQIALEHHQAGRLAEAEAIYRRILVEFPDHGGVLHLLGVLAGQAGYIDSAIDLIGRAVASNAEVAEYHSNLGEFYGRAGQWDRAISSLRRAIELQPNLAVAHGNLCRALLDAGRIDEAIGALRRAVEQQPDDFVAHYHLGNALRQQGQNDAAIAAYRRAIELKPNHAQAHNNLGVALEEAGRLDEAVVAYNRAIELAPKLPEVHYNVGITRQRLGQIDEAIAAFGQAIALQPDFADAHSNLSDILLKMGRLDEALTSLRTALAARPSALKIASNLLCLLHFHPDYDAQAILAEHRRWGRQFTEPLADQIRPHDNDRSPDRMLRVGLISPGFCDSQQGQLIQPLFRNHDHTRYRFIAYSDTRKPDAVTEELKSLVEEWHDTSRLSDPQVSDLVRSHRIDILVDMALHLASNRMPVFARKPAPIQVSAFEVIATTGLDTIDYRLTDPYLDPPGETDGDYTEQSIRLPHCFWCYRPPSETPPVAALPALQNRFITFGCFNSFLKFNRPTLELWARVLQAVPTARMIVHAASAAHRGYTQRVLEGAGVDCDRIDFVPTVSRVEYLRRHHSVDIGLDTQPYAGATTTMDALWMGVPVITLAGRTAVGRAGVSILTNLGLPDLVARSAEEYAAIAVDWARDLKRLADVRAGLRERMLASPVMDGKRSTADVEAAFREMWRAWCNPNSLHPLRRGGRGG